MLCRAKHRNYSLFISEATSYFITEKPCISSIPQGIAYHQDKVLYIIIAKDFLYTPKGVMRYKGGNAALDDIQPDG